MWMTQTGLQFYVEDTTVTIPTQRFCLYMSVKYDIVGFTALKTDKVSFMQWTVILVLQVRNAHANLLNRT